LWSTSPHPSIFDTNQVAQPHVYHCGDRVEIDVPGINSAAKRTEQARCKGLDRGFPVAASGCRPPSRRDPLTGYPKKNRLLQTELARFARRTKPVDRSAKKARSTLNKFLEGVKGVPLRPR